MITIITAENCYTKTDVEVDQCIKIQSTVHDRKVRYTQSDVDLMRELRRRGISAAKIAALLGWNTRSVYYHTDDKYKKRNKKPGAHARGQYSLSDRAMYKRQLVVDNVDLTPIV